MVGQITDPPVRPYCQEQWLCTDHTVRSEQDNTGSYSLPDGLRAELCEVAIANTPTISRRGLLRHVYFAIAGTAIGHKWLVALHISSFPQHLISHFPRSLTHAGGRDVSFELISVSFQLAAILKAGAYHGSTLHHTVDLLSLIIRNRNYIILI